MENAACEGAAGSSGADRGRWHHCLHVRTSRSSSPPFCTLNATNFSLHFFLYQKLHALKVIHPLPLIPVFLLFVTG